MLLPQLSWSPSPTSDTNCPPVIYIITIIAANSSLVLVERGTTNVTNKKIVDNLTQGEKYHFIVAGVDAGGRVRENSVLSSIVLDSK